MKNVNKDSEDIVRVLSTNITYEPVIQDYPREIVKFGKLFFKKVHEKPEEIIKQIDNLMVHHPHQPVLINWKIGAYQIMGTDEKMVEFLIEDSYKKFPDYLFSRTAYSQLCFTRNRWPEIPDIFNNHFSLNDLYPHRDVFHVTEATAFYHVIGKYYAYAKKFESAWACLQLLQQIDDADDKANDLMMTLIKQCPLKYMSTKLQISTKKFFSSTKNVKS